LALDLRVYTVVVEGQDSVQKAPSPEVGRTGVSFCWAQKAHRACDVVLVNSSIIVSWVMNHSRNEALRPQLA
jgi:hypothetical protein